MAFKNLTSFEILAARLAPIPDVPFVQQGFFLQISNLETHAITVDLEYVASPAFVAVSAPYQLTADIIKEDGVPPNAAQIALDVAEFLTPPVGFKAKAIPPKGTWLFGVQYLLAAPPVPEPTVDIEARGFVRLQASTGSKVLVLGTIRQVFNNYSGGLLSDVAEAAYAIPLVGGPELSF
jgi:hypothetical protein